MFPQTTFQRIKNSDRTRTFHFIFNIPFHLLYDKGSKVSDKLGLLKRAPPDHLYPLRVTYLVDKNRVILGKWDEIDVQTHSDDVVSFVVEILEKNEIVL